MFFSCIITMWGLGSLGGVLLPIFWVWNQKRNDLRLQYGFWNLPTTWLLISPMGKIGAHGLMSILMVKWWDLDICQKKRPKCAILKNFTIRIDFSSMSYYSHGPINNYAYADVFTEAHLDHLLKNDQKRKGPFAPQDGPLTRLYHMSNSHHFMKDN